MKNMMAALVATTLLSLPALANEEFVNEQEQQFTETELGPISSDELATLVDPSAMETMEDGNVIAGAILGATDATQVEDAQARRRGPGGDMRRGPGRRGPGEIGRGPGRRPPGHIGRGPGHRNPPPRYNPRPRRPIIIPIPLPINRSVTCFAQNRRGEVFRVAGYNRAATQRQAMNKCNARSATACRPMGCR